MFPRTKKVDTKNAHYGKPQTPKERFASRLNWLRFQILAANGNVSSAMHHANHEFTAASTLLTDESAERFNSLRGELRTITARLKGIAEEIAELNSPDKWAK